MFTESLGDLLYRRLGKAPEIVDLVWINALALSEVV